MNIQVPSLLVGVIVGMGLLGFSLVAYGAVDGDGTQAPVLALAASTAVPTAEVTVTVEPTATLVPPTLIAPTAVPPPPTPRPAIPATSVPVVVASGANKLALVSANCSRSSTSYLRCEGFVKNISGASLKNVEAIVTYYDANNTPIFSDDALIDYNPILADQQSAWHVLLTYNPAGVRWSVAFKDLLGGSISSRDDRH